jgi:hypothetical protein
MDADQVLHQMQSLVRDLNRAVADRQHTPGDVLDLQVAFKQLQGEFTRLNHRLSQLEWRFSEATGQKAAPQDQEAF